MNIVETIKFLETGDDVEAQLEAFKKLNATVTENDLPVLLDAIKSETSNFWVRELLSEPISNLAGAEAIPKLMAALQKNFEEGHNNDSFQLSLTVLAKEDPKGARTALEKLAKTATKAELDSINWLLEYCQ